MLEDWLFRLGHEAAVQPTLQELQNVVRLLERRRGVVGKPRRKVALPTRGFRFLTRTIWLVAELVSEYEFVVCPGLLPEGVDAIKASGAEFCWVFYPFREGDVARAAFQAHGIPYVVTNRGAFWCPVPRPQSVAVLGDAACITSLSETYMRQVRTLYPALRDKVYVVIPNGVTAPSTLPLYPNLIPRSFVAAVNTRFAPKRQAAEELVEHFTKHARGTPHVLTLAVAGEHPAFPDGWLTEQVFVAGFVRDIFRFLASGQVFLHHSYLDSQPSILMEAMFAGLPCIVTRHADSGAWEFAPPLGIVDTVEELVSTGERMLTDPDLRAACRAQAMRRGAQAYTWGRAAAAYRKVFEHVG